MYVLLNEIDLNFYVTGTGNGNTLTQKYSYNGLSSIFEKEKPVNQVHFHPNPFNNFTIGKLRKTAKSIEVRIFDSLGRLVKVEELKNTSQIKIEGKNLIPGLYYYQISGSDFYDSGRLIKN